jgi:NTE family protein
MTSSATRDAVLQVVPPLCPVDSSPYDYSACAQLIERAATTTREWIVRGGLERGAVGAPPEMVEHAHGAAAHAHA